MKRVAARACDGVVVWNTDRGRRRSKDLEDRFKLIEGFASFAVASSRGRLSHAVIHPHPAAGQTRFERREVG
jgi:hypothetical protein